MTKGGTLESQSQRETDRGDGRGGPGGPLADARPGRVPWHDRRTPECVAQDRAREGRLSSRAEEHARSPRRRRNAVRGGVGQHGRPPDLRFFRGRGRRGEGRLRLRQDQRQADPQAGAYAGKALDAKGVQSLASIPSKEVLLSQLLGLMQSPIARIARVLAMVAEKRGGGAEAPAAAAPAAEAAPAAA